MIEIIPTEDGSATLYTEQFDEHYHSIHGAEQESQLIYLTYGLEHRLQILGREYSEPVQILEMGFGTGLNAWLTLLKCTELKQKVHYTTIEKFPIELSVAEGLGYEKTEEEKSLFLKLHQAEWGRDVKINEYFTLHKRAEDLLAYQAEEDCFDVIYFDAFSPNRQPELWAEEVFQYLAKIGKQGAVLSTYCAMGEVRRRLQRSGFTMERLAGPIGKREVLRGTLAKEK